MQAYFEPEQDFSIGQPVFEVLIAYKKKHVYIYIAERSSYGRLYTLKYILLSL